MERIGDAEGDELGDVEGEGDVLSDEGGCTSKLAMRAEVRLRDRDR